MGTMDRVGRLPLVSAHAPRMLPGLIDRPRLHDRLPLAAITVVRGPGGASKTVLLGQLVARMPEERGSWITVGEEGIRSRTPFWRHVIAHTLGDDAARIVEVLRAAAERLVVVVDDSHRLSTTQYSGISMSSPGRSLRSPS